MAQDYYLVPPVASGVVRGARGERPVGLTCVCFSICVCFTAVCLTGVSACVCSVCVCTN